MNIHRTASTRAKSPASKSRATGSHRKRAALAAGLAAAALLPVLMSSGSGSAAAPPPAHPGPAGPNTVGLKQVGPIDETNGFPISYTDTSGQRLELCLATNDPYCVMGNLPTPGQPLVFPTNFPDEAFWSMADASLATNANGGKALLVTSLEAAFAGDVAPGQQISFGRIRLRVSGLIDGADYKVTHPFGLDTYTAEAGNGNIAGAARGINVTEDIGDLAGGSTFEAALGSRPAPFLKWDPAIAPAAPAGHLGDPTVDHQVTGSPYGTNIFRIEGPAGSFTGSPNLCANPALGDSPTATDDCIETNLFSIMGKNATRAGVQVTKTVTTKDSGSGNFIDLFAKSQPGQTLVITGTGIAATAMRQDGNGGYYARIRVDGAAPPDFAVTNTTDNPKTVDHVDPTQFSDKVHVNSAIYDNDTKTLIVLAQSGDPAAALTLAGYPTAVHDTSGTSQRFTVSLDAPPADVNVTSTKGGSDGDDVVITGAAFTAQQVVAAITADATNVATGQKVTLDGTGSTGTILSYAWTQTSGPSVTLTTPTGSVASFTPAAAGQYTFTLTVTGAGTGNTSSQSITITAHSSAAPTANAGPDQLNVAPTSTVTLSGSASAFAASYSWSQTGGPAVTLSRTDVANPTFIAPANTTPQTLTFQLTVKDAAGLHPSTDTVIVTTDPDDLGVASAQFKRGGAEWRIRGTAQYCSANNAVTFTWNKPGATPVVLGTLTPALAAGVCSYDFRLKNAPTAAQPTAGGTITATSVMGGLAANQTFVFG